MQEIVNVNIPSLNDLLLVPGVVPLQIGEKEYYNSKDLQAYKPEFYYGFTSKPRNIIHKKNIPKEEYVYATFEKLTKKWNPTDESCKKAQLLISKQWVDQFYFKSQISTVVVGDGKKKKIINNVNKIIYQQQPQIITSAPVCPQGQEEQPTTSPPPPQRDYHETDNGDEDQVSEEEGEEEGEEEQEQQEIENAPPLLHLDDGEKFHDANGNVIEIETRGERHREKIYFKVKDVSVGFGMPSLSRNILCFKAYERVLHYTTFKRDFTLHSMESKNTNKPSKTLIYLTYKGLLRVLFVSRNNNADKFQDWAEEKLFTIQMGTRDQKVKLGAEILNTSPRTLKVVLDKHASTFPSIYLMSLGKVRDVRETFGIPVDKPDDSTVYKFGFSEDLARRVMELESEYSKLPGVTIQNAIFQIIDAKYTSEAENEVREFCSAYKLRVKKTIQGKIELVVLDDNEFAYLKKTYRRIGAEFAGATLGLQKQIKEYENELMRLKIEMQYKDDLHKKDIEYYKKDIELKETVIENWKLKYQLATSTFASPKQEQIEREFSMVRC